MSSNFDYAVFFLNEWINFENETIYQRIKRNYKLVDKRDKSIEFTNKKEDSKSLPLQNRLCQYCHNETVELKSCCDLMMQDTSTASDLTPFPKHTKKNKNYFKNKLLKKLRECKKSIVKS